MNPATIVQILNLIAAASPGVVNVIAAIRHEDGSVSVLTILDDADANASETMKRILEWQKENPAK